MFTFIVLAVIGALWWLAHKNYGRSGKWRDRRHRSSWAWALIGALLGSFAGVAALGGAIAGTIPGAFLGFLLASNMMKRDHDYELQQPLPHSGHFLDHPEATHELEAADLNEVPENNEALDMYNELQSVRASIEKTEKELQTVKERYVGTEMNLAAHMLKPHCLDDFEAEIRQSLSETKATLMLQQKQAQALYEKGLELLNENKQRETTALRWMQRIELLILAGVIVVLVSIWLLISSR